MRLGNAKSNVIPIISLRREDGMLDMEQITKPDR